MHIAHRLLHLAQQALEWKARGVKTSHQHFQTCFQASDALLGSPAGLSDKRIAAVLQHLAQQARELGGEMMLGQLIDAAREQLTELNYPEGDCCFCLEPLLQPGWSPAQLVDDLLKLPCFHCFHR